MRIHFLQHVFFEKPGIIEPYLRGKNHVITYTYSFEEEFQLPDVSDIEALIIMGGPMGVYEEQKFPWLKAEKKFIKDCIDAGKKVLGICLGAQLIASCLSVAVKPAPNKEIGWFKVMPTEACSKIKWLNDLFREEPVVFHWHGDQFELPDREVGDVLFSEANRHQFLYLNENVLGLQFHLEVTEETLSLMLENGADDLKKGPFIQDDRSILEGRKNIGKCNRLMAEILDHWLG